ncbi:disulfide isomerase pTAC5, chloroplastic-like isoform X2 [Olea europaea subsp. europaea]|uniref:Disulfide isomerase pTAC5, chloroplastic-like isoform X2 n=1 Tax=Olea europaea subsp. europaea TaxID=158383 RepID=A0A8S0RLS0_OLEEU|nr:disulfide isomerase pTAC5, chloroplastic-like isoform X2 [Olea europaea subsp. europaea]
MVKDALAIAQSRVIKEGETAKNVNRIAESGSIPVPLVVEAAKRDEEFIVKEVADRDENLKRRVSLRKGSEGDDVRAMQEAFKKLGFYSGEEDMELYIEQNTGISGLGVTNNQGLKPNLSEKITDIDRCLLR